MNAEEVRTSLAGLTLPEPDVVADWRVSVGRDWTGDPAVWVFVIVRDEAIERLWPFWDDLRLRIRQAVAGIASPETMTYVRLQAASEVTDATTREP